MRFTITALKLFSLSNFISAFHFPKFSTSSKFIVNNQFNLNSHSNKIQINDSRIHVLSNILGRLFFISLPFICYCPNSHAGYLSEMNVQSNLNNGGDGKKIQTTIEIAGKPRQSPRAHVYSVEFTDPPSLLPRTTAGERSAIDKLLTTDAVILGKHYQNTKDNQLAVNILDRMLSQIKSKSQSITVGLTNFPITDGCQKALDTYTLGGDSTTSTSASVSGGVSANLVTSLKEASVSDEDVADALPVLQFARQHKLKVIALGLPAVGVDTSQQQLVSDTEGFIQSTRGNGFTRYVDLVVKEDYKDVLNAAASSNSNNNKMTFEEYVGIRLLSNEVAASTAAKYITASASVSTATTQSAGIASSKSTAGTNTLVVLTDQHDVKFGYGLQERLIRNINYQLSPPSTSSPTVTSTDSTPTETAATQSSATMASQAKVISILLNPTPTDTGGRTAQLRLCLAYGSFLKDQRPLANYLWYDEDPPVRYLARLKNPINKEGDKPPGESSMIGAF